MCGISGVIRFDKEAVRKEQLQIMMQKIKQTQLNRRKWVRLGDLFSGYKSNRANR